MQEDTSKKFWQENAILWSIVGIFTTIILGTPALYFTFHENKPHILYQILSESNVLDIHTTLKDLEIRYRGVNIQQQHKNLKIYRLLVKNNGDTDIRQNDFDQNTQWGIKILDGQIVERPKLNETNSSYLKEAVNPASTDPNHIVFQKVILERGKFFIIDTQVLHDINQLPSLTVFGKITGIDMTEQNIMRPDITIEKQFLRRVFDESLSIQAARLLIFGLVGIFIIFIVLFIIFYTENLAKKISIKRAVRKLDDYLAPIIEGKSPKEVKIIKYLFLHAKGLNEYIKNIHKALNVDQQISRQKWEVCQIQKFKDIYEDKKDWYDYIYIDENNVIYIPELYHDKDHVSKEFSDAVDKLLQFTSDKNIPKTIGKILDSSQSGDILRSLNLYKKL